MNATTYMWNYAKKPNADFDRAKVTIIQEPKHGTLTNGDWNEDIQDFVDPPAGTAPFLLNQYRYVPDKGYVGKDFVVMQAEQGGLKVQIYYFIHVHIPQAPYSARALCGRKGGQWKISLPEAPLDTPTIQSLVSSL